MSVLQRGQYAEVCVRVSLCMHDLRKGDLFVSWARVHRVCLGSISCVVCSILSFCDYGGMHCDVGVYVLFYNCIWVYADVCCVSSALLNVVCFLSLGMCL